MNYAEGKVLVTQRITVDYSIVPYRDREVNIQHCLSSYQIVSRVPLDRAGKIISIVFARSYEKSFLPCFHRYVPLFRKDHSAKIDVVVYHCRPKQQPTIYPGT